MFALALAATAHAQELRLRALLTTPLTDGDAAVADLGLRGEARLVVHEDGQARLDLVGWTLPEGPVEVALRLDAAGDAPPLVVLPLQRDAQEGRVIGATFRLDAGSARRLAAGEGRVLLTSARLPVAIAHGALRPHRRPSETPARARLQAAD